MFFSGTTHLGLFASLLASEKKKEIEQIQELEKLSNNNITYLRETFHGKSLFETEDEINDHQEMETLSSNNITFLLEGICTYVFFIANKFSMINVLTQENIGFPGYKLSLQKLICRD